MAARTLRVHLYAGPGTGKSTTAALVFGALKQRGCNVEIVHEFAKDLTWEGHQEKLKFQPYVVAKQMWWMERLEDKVKAVITDTSTLLGLIYGDLHTDADVLFAAWVVAEYQSHPTLNFFLERDPNRAYNPAGRSQSEDEAVGLDDRTRGLLADYDIPFESVQVNKSNDAHVAHIVRRVEEALNAGNA